MPRLKLTLAYEGTRYAGWQVQAFRTKERPLTIQGELERVIAEIVGSRVPVHGAGRTDAGVHALAQVCHADVPEETRVVDWKRALNVRLPYDIRIVAAQWAQEGFHSRRSASGKRYVYSLWMHRDRALPCIQAFVWSAPPLDTARMEAVFPLLVGRRDFASFQNRGGTVTATVRTVHGITLRPGFAGALACPPDWPVTSVIVEGDGFLKQMVRNIAGLLVWVGQGKLDPRAIPAIIDARTRSALPSPSAPAQGLTLLDVLY